MTVVTQKNQLGVAGLYRMSLWYDLVTPLQILVTFILCMKQNTPVVNATNLYKTAKFEDFLSGSNRKSFYMIYYRPQLPSVRHCQRKEASMLWSHYEETRQLPGERHCKEQCQVHAGEEDHARPGWTTSRRGQDSPWKSQSK